jgi:2OG-Fe(II) oxygenase superfamily
MLRLSKSGPICTASAEDFELWRTSFDRNHLIQLRGFLEPSLLQLIQDVLERTPFHRRVQETGIELRAVDPTPYYALELLMNSPKLFRIVREMTGCPGIVCFNGRIYRRLPSPEYNQSWHNDVTRDGRLIAVSVNLSRSAYAGGVLQIRHAGSQQIISEAHNTGFGDALLFRIDPDLEHRLTPVEGDVPKTAMAGWFKSKPEPRSLFARGVSPSRSGAMER